MKKEDIWVYTGEFDRSIPPDPYVRLANKKEREKHNRLMKTYGISLLEFQKMSIAGCHICEIKEGRLCVDHIHVLNFKNMEPTEKRKYVRGILCFLCNTGIKGFDKTKDGKKNRQRLEGTYQYFKIYRLKGE